MNLSRICCAGAMLLGSLSLAASARAQADASLSEVRKAYADVDYERTRSLAAAAIRRGGSDRASTSELYLLWATAAAAVDKTDEARQAFTYALAANPELKLDRNLSPKIRAPYLEARGAMAGADDKPPLDVTVRPRKQELELALHDILQVAASLVVSTRAGEGTPFSRRRFEAAATRRVPKPVGSELQFFVQVLDRYGNVLFDLGTEEEPQRLVQVTSERPGPVAPTARGKDASPVPYYVTSGVLAGLGLAAGGAATAMFVRREDAAREWNSTACEQPGLTRAAQCGSVDDRRKKSEYLAIGFTAAGGALLLGSVISLVLAPSSSSRANVALDVSPDKLMLRLRTSL
jgi:hypothetical protein